jgi:DNA-binding XRE family transcriptional regulator
MVCMDKRPLTVPEIRDVRRGREIVATGELRRVREACGLTQAELSRMLGVYPSNIVNWERDQRPPVARHAIKIARVIDRLHPLVEENVAN